MFTSLFWKDAGERAFATMAQVLVSLLAVDGFDLLQVDTKAFVATVLTAGLLSVVKAIAAAKLTDSTVSPASLVTDDRGF